MNNKKNKNIFNSESFQKGNAYSNSHSGFKKEKKQSNYMYELGMEYDLGQKYEEDVRNHSSDKYSEDYEIKCNKRERKPKN